MDNEIQNRIDAYLRGEMTDLERDAFEEKVKTDTAWADQLELTRLIQQGLAERQKKLEKMAGWDEERAKAPVPVGKKRRYLWWCASLVAACLLGVFLVLQREEPQSYVYDADFFRHETSYRGGGNEYAIDQMIASCQYETALSTIDSLEDICRQELETVTTGELDEEKSYHRLVAEETFYQLTWRRIQIYLAQNEKARAASLLRTFRWEKGEYHEKANDLWVRLGYGADE